MGLHKILKIVAAILGVAALVLAGIVWSKNDALQSGEASAGIVDNFILLALVVLGIVIVLVLVFVLKGLFTGNAKNALIGIGAFLIVIGISFALSSGVETPLKDGGVLSANGSRWVEAGIKAFYILAATAIGIMVFSGVKKLIK